MAQMPSGESMFYTYTYSIWFRIDIWIPQTHMMVDTCCGCKDINIYNIGCNTDKTGCGIRGASKKNHMKGCGISAHQKKII